MEPIEKNWSWGSIADWAETYDRRMISYDHETFEWIADTMRSGRPNYSNYTSMPFMEMLQSTAPNDRSHDEWERQQRLSFVVSIELERLPKNDAWLIYMLYEVRLSLRFCARVLRIPKTTLSRRRDEILQQLGESLRQYPIIREILGEKKMTEQMIEQPQDLPPLEGIHFWEDAAEWSYKALTQMDSVGFSLEELMGEGRSMFPEPPHLQWWADLLHATESEYPININDLVNLLSAKQHDYGYENILSFQQLGCIVRASDKVARLRNLKNKEVSVQDESMEDSYLDLAGYCVIAAMLAYDLFTLPQL